MDRSIPILKHISAKAKKTAIRYSGEVAMRYDAKRMNTPKWIGEDHRVREFLSDLPQGTAILDIPCGTGRFFSFYREKGFNVLAMDISSDMMDKAKKQVGDNIKIETGNIFDIGISKGFDVIVCVRFLNLIESIDLKHVLAEMQRAARSRIIFTLRVKQKNPTKHYHRARPVSLIKESLLDGWKIGRNEPVHEEDYRLLELVR